MPDFISAKRKRIPFHSKEDTTILQAISLIKKYVDPIRIHWFLLKPIIPNRRESSIKRRYQVLEGEMKNYIIQFLNVFERRYSEAQQRGEVKPIETGPAFDLQYCLDWYNDQCSEPCEEIRLPEIPSSPNLQQIEAGFKPRKCERLPKNIGDFKRLFEVGPPQESKTSWHSEYYRKDGPSTRRRYDALYSEPFITPLSTASNVPAVNQALDRVESLLKVSKYLLSSKITSQSC